MPFPNSIVFSEARKKTDRDFISFVSHKTDLAFPLIATRALDTSSTTTMASADSLVLYLGIIQIRVE